MQIRRIIALCGALIVLGSASLPLAAQDKKDQKKPKLTKQEEQDEETLFKLVNGVQAGQPAPSALGLTWYQDHFLKLSVDRTYSAFTVNVSGATGPLSVYVRAVPKGAPAPSDKDKKAALSFAAEALSFIDAPADGRVSRAINVPAGEYDLFVAVKEKATGKRNEVSKAAVLRKQLAVPDFAGPALTTSSVILVANVEGTQPPAPEQAHLFPYTLGAMKITPAGPEGTLSTAGELSVLFWIYGATPVGVKPDVQVEYNFHQRLADGEKYFNKTAPQALNGQTLPPEFDLSTGVLLMASQSLPLKSFPPGNYRLEIKITDKPSGKSVTQNVNFTVTA